MCLSSMGFTATVALMACFSLGVRENILPIDPLSKLCHFLVILKLPRHFSDVKCIKYENAILQNKHAFEANVLGRASHDDRNIVVFYVMLHCPLLSRLVSELRFS